MRHLDDLLNADKWNKARKKKSSSGESSENDENNVKQCEKPEEDSSFSESQQNIAADATGLETDSVDKVVEKVKDTTLQNEQPLDISDHETENNELPVTEPKPSYSRSSSTSRRLHARKRGIPPRIIILAGVAFIIGFSGFAAFKYFTHDNETKGNPDTAVERSYDAGDSQLTDNPGMPELTEVDEEQLTGKVSGEFTEEEATDYSESDAALEGEPYADDEETFMLEDDDASASLDMEETVETAGEQQKEDIGGEFTEEEATDYSESDAALESGQYADDEETFTIGDDDASPSLGMEETVETAGEQQKEDVGSESLEDDQAIELKEVAAASVSELDVINAATTEPDTEEPDEPVEVQHAVKESSDLQEQKEKAASETTMTKAETEKKEKSFPDGDAAQNEGGREHAALRKDEKIKSPVFTEMFLTYEEQFENNANKWDTFDTGTASARIENGIYFIENKRQVGAHIILHNHNLSIDEDFRIEVSMRPVENLTYYGYGFVFGAKDVLNNLIFLIRDDQSYLIRQDFDGISDELASGKIKNMFINNDTPNLLKIVKQGEELLFYINDNLIDTISHVSFNGDKIGFTVEGKIKVAVDWIRAHVRLDKK